MLSNLVQGMIFLIENYLFCMFFWGAKFEDRWLIAQLVERSLSVMKDPGSNRGADNCSFPY